MIIQTQEQLDALCAALSAGPYLTIDTEFLRDKTYFPRLCLLQLAGPEVNAAAIDPFIEGLDWEPVRALMANKDVLKVFHAARQDLEIFYHLYGELPTPIYDTQVAAMVCGFGDQVAYNALVRELTGHELEKNAQFTDWSRRPLSERQIRYALDDVIYLREVYEKLHARLVKQGREQWVFEEMAVLESPRTYQNPPMESWKRVKIRSDRPEVLAILQGLAAWREEQAVSRDVPRSRILKDETLADIAMYKPRDEDALLQIRSLPSDLAKGKIGKQVLEIANRVLDGPKDNWPRIPRKEPFPKNAAGTLEMLKMLLRINCAEEDVAAKLVADSDDLEKIAVEKEPDVAAMHGWRFEMFGKDALDLKAGKIALRLEKGRVKKVAV
ncbi:MAG: ribonuclease D [Micavibrio aeruginosavorus]|uniref:Ribonuclease D n=1 Tax=Micavibrio aeruginosavorus TaxID=349221 RepID=A0A2W5N1M5_9BACT|nr:MAG: ribonuclease D [Micavibrio aeruginosavorus]